jgi:hypothetical protein
MTGMNMMKLIALCVFTFSCVLASAQSPDDPQLIGKDGLPATRPPRFENYSREGENEESTERNRSVDRVQDREQYNEEFFSEEKQRESHFQADTLTMHHFDEKGKQIKSPQNIYQGSSKPDTVKTGISKPGSTPDGVDRPR